MTVSRLPEIAVTCKNRHTFGTRAHGGQAVDCPQCRAGGERVKVWVRKDRPRTAREVAEHAAIDAPAPDSAARQLSAELAARWQQEQPWDGRLRLVPGRAGDACSECSGPVQWEPGRTLVYCPECKRAGLPAAVTDHYARQLRRSTEVAVRAAPDESAERAARVRLRARKDAVKHRVQAWLESIADEYSYDQVQWQRQACELAAMLRAYLPEISEAATETALAGVLRDIDALITSEQSQTLKNEYQQAQQRAEQQQRQARYQQELAEQLESERQQAERERQAADREASKQLAQQERKAITGGQTTATLRLSDNPYAPAMAMLAQWQQNKDRKIASKGKCAFRHLADTPAARIYGVPQRSYGGQDTGYALPGAPQYRACAKHYQAAESQLNRDGYSDHVYWEL